MNQAIISRDPPRPWWWVAIVTMPLIMFPGCRETTAPPHMARDLGTEGQPLPPTSSVWTNPAINDGQAEWVPFRAPGTPKKKESSEDNEESGTEAIAPDDKAGDAESDSVSPEIAALLDEYNKLAAANNTDEMVKYFVESQEAQLRSALEGLAAIRDSTAKLSEKLLQQDGADAEAVKSGTEKLTGFASAMLRATETHAHEDEKVHITFDAGNYLAGAHAILDGKDWYLEVIALPTADEIKGKLTPIVERVASLGENTPSLAEVQIALESMDLPPLGSAEHADEPPSPVDSVTPSPKEEPE